MNDPIQITFSALTLLGLGGIVGGNFVVEVVDGRKISFDISTGLS